MGKDIINWPVTDLTCFLIQGRKVYSSLLINLRFTPLQWFVGFWVDIGQIRISLGPFVMRIRCPVRNFNEFFLLGGRINFHRRLSLLFIPSQWFIGFSVGFGEIMLRFGPFRLDWFTAL